MPVEQEYKEYKEIKKEIMKLESSIGEITVY